MTGTLDFFDTNILVAASIPNHIHHQACYERIASLHVSGAACAVHTLAETYNNLTRTTRGYGLPPADVLIILKFTKETFRLITLDPDEYMATIETVAQQNKPGPIVYDALLLACARKIDAHRIYTNNLKHFRDLAPDLASRIVAP